jgi:hypothetical protein
LAVRAVQHIRRMRGGAQGQLMLGEDGHAYVVKFQNNPQHTRVLVNEFLASRLAAAVGLSTPEVELIEVNPWLVENTPELEMDLGKTRERCRPGLLWAADGATIRVNAKWDGRAESVRYAQVMPGQLESSGVELRDDQLMYIRMTTAPENGTPFTRRVGTTAEAAECLVESAGKLIFYVGYAPPVGQQIAVSYRAAGR